jgi:hypothetical protein
VSAARIGDREEAMTASSPTMKRIRSRRHNGQFYTKSIDLFCCSIARIRTRGSLGSFEGCGTRITFPVVSYFSPELWFVWPAASVLSRM